MLSDERIIRDIRENYFFPSKIIYSHNNFFIKECIKEYRSISTKRTIVTTYEFFLILNFYHKKGETPFSAKEYPVL